MLNWPLCNDYITGLRTLVHIARTLLCEEKCKLKDAKKK